MTANNQPRWSALLLSLLCTIGAFATPDGGSVSDLDGNTTVYTCPGDGILDEITLMNTSSSSDPYQYIVTDDMGLILALPPANMVELDGAGIGTCLVYGLSYTGTLTVSEGEYIDSVAAFSDASWELSDNVLSAVRDIPEGGTVSTEDGETTVYTCPGDSIADVLSFDHVTSSASAFAYVVTDDNNIILGLPDADMVDFEGAGIGTCRVWGLSYTGSITAMLGDDAAAVALSDGCFDLSDNFVSVVRDVPDGGTVTTEDGETTVYTCPGDSIADVLSFDHVTSSASAFAYVVTDDNNIILGLPDADMVDFEGAGIGTCRVWGLSYTGSITAMLGDDAAAVALSDGCFDLSDNFVSVVRDVPDGGTVTTEDGETTVYTCPGDSIADVLSFDHVTSSASAFAYVVTDDNNIILGLPDADMVDFEGAGIGTCRVWGLSYTGSITAMLGDDAAAVALSDGCFDLSDNFVSVVRDVPDGGTVTTEDGETTVYTCPGDSIADVLSFDHVTSSASAFAYVVTDDNNIILGLPEADMVDFEGAGIGTCRVWGLSYTGSITAMLGDDAAAVALSDGCFDLSDNFVSVVRDVPDGGTVTTEDGETTVYTCPGDSIADFISFDHVTSSASAFAYVVTDDNNIILGLPDGDMVDFEGAGIGTCRVWGLSYTGSITAMLGDDAAAVALSDGCFDLSDNFVSVVRDTPEGGSLSFIGGETSVTVCAGDGEADDLYFEVSGNSSSNFTYIITDASGYILDFPPTGFVSLDGAGPGECLIYGLSFTGNLTAMAGDNVGTLAAFSDECWDLSDNSISAVRLDSAVCAAGACPAPSDLEVIMVDSNTVVLNWSAEAGVLGYQIQAKRNGTPALNETLLSNTMAYDFKPGKRYDWRFRSLLVSGLSDWSDVNTYEAPAARLATSDFEMQVFPNPAHAQARIQWPVQEEEAVLSLLDLSGRVLQIHNIAAGSQAMDLNLQDLEAGMYQVIWQSGQNLEQMTLIVQ